MSIQQLSQDQKELIRELYRRSQENPNQYTPDKLENINELYRRLDAPDVFRTALDNASTPQEALEYVDKYKYDTPSVELLDTVQPKDTVEPIEAPEAPKTKGLFGGPATPPEAMSTPSNMSVEKVLQEDKVKQDIQKEMDEAKERKRIQYTQMFGVDPNKDKVTAFRNWWDKTKQDPEKLDKYVQKYQTETDMYRAFEKSVEKGTLEKQFDIEVPKVLEIPKQDNIVTNIADTLKKYENVNEEFILETNNPYASIFTPYMESLGAEKSDRTFVGSDGKTYNYAKFQSLDQAEIANKKMLARMLEARDGDIRQVISDYIDKPLDSLEVENRYKEITSKDLAQPKPEFDMSLIQPTAVAESTKQDIKEPVLQKQDTPERDIYQAMSEFKLSEIAPFYASSQEAVRLAKALKLISQLKSGISISNEDKTFLKELADDRKFEDSTIAAKAFDTVKEMIPFAGEIFATYGVFGIAKKASQKMLSKKIKSEIKDYVEKGLLIDTSSKIVRGSKFLTEAALLNQGFLTLSKMDDKISLEKQVPQFVFANNGLLITRPGMDKHTADKQANYEASKEFLVEIFSIKLLQKTFPYIAKAFKKKIKTLPPGESEVLVSQATANTFGDAIERVTGLKLKKQDLIKARQFLQSFGYNGVLSEWAEERIGDATNELVYALANAKDANGESLLPGFDNEEYADNVVRDLLKGEFGSAAERTLVELIAFSVPAAGINTYAGTKSYIQEKSFKKGLPELSKQLSDKEEKFIEIEPELKRLKEIEKPSPDEVIKLSKLIEQKTTLDALRQIKQITIDSPEIIKEVDLKDVNLDKELEITRKELEEQGVTMEGEGLEADAEVATILGHTTLANSKLGLGLGKGASYDTVLEEYYGLVRRGGLSAEQKQTYDEHYEKYKTDSEYRVKVNEFINRMHDKMGLRPAVADVNQVLSSDKLFDKEGKSYEYKAVGEPKKDIADKVFDYVGNLFNKAFGRSPKKEEMKDVYQKVQDRKLKISTDKAIELERQKRKPDEIPEAEVEFKPEKIEVTKKLPKGISYQMSVKEVGKKLANPKKVTEENKLNVAVAQGLRETIKAIENTEDGIIHESLNWYGTRIEQTLDLADKELNFETKEDEVLFTTILALQSQATELEINYNTAINSYKYFKENNTFKYGPSPAGSEAVISTNINDKEVVVGGTQLNAVRDNHKKLEFIINKFGLEKGMNFLLTKHSGKDLRNLIEESKIIKAPPYILAGKEYYGGRLFGPKIGNFTVNMNGKSDVATYDRWWIRTWGRWMGTPEMTSFTNKDEALMNETLDAIGNTLTETTGYEFDKPAIQAVLWYYEKELYINNDAKVPQGKDYLGSAEARAEEKGYATTPTDIKKARRVTEQRISKEKADTASLKEGIKETGKKARQKTPEVSYQFNKPQKVKVKKDKKKGIGKPGVSYQLREAKKEYGISHRPSKEGPPAHDLFEGNMVPDDVYDTPRYYIGSLPKDKIYRETVNAIRYLRSIKGNPEAEVIVYRAGPKRELNNGDWITLSKTYAEEHADSWNTFEVENYKLHEFKVKAKDVLWDMNSLEEWGYYPKEKPQVSYQLTPTQKEFFKDTKVVDSKGEPKVVYHGTTKDFDAFYDKHTNMFAVDPSVASHYAGQPVGVKGGRVVPVNLNIKNPLIFNENLGDDMTPIEFVKSIEKATGKRFRNDEVVTIGDYGTTRQQIVKESKDGFKEPLYTYIDYNQNLINYLESLGYDGIKTSEGGDDIWIAFNANQIKSATAMADKPSKDPRISYQLAPVNKPLDIYKRITGKEKFGRDAKKESMNRYNSAVIPISTLLSRMNPKLYSHLLKHQFNVVTRISAASDIGKDFAVKVKKLKKQDRIKLKLAMLNSDAATIMDVIENNDNEAQDFMLSYKNLRNLLDNIREQLIESGEEVGLIEDYFPRKVSDYEKFEEYMYGDEATKTILEKQLKEAEKKKGSELSTREKEEIINMVIRGYSYLGTKPGFLKGRKVNKVTLDMMSLYRDPITQLFNHFDIAIERIENRKFLGISNKETQDMTQAERKTFYDESVGRVVQNLIENEGIKLTDKQQKEYIRILSAYFSFTPTSEIYGAIKTIVYGQILGNFTNTVTQFQDIIYAIYENRFNQLRTIKNVSIYLGSKLKNIDRIKRTTIGVDIPGIEYKMDSKSNIAKFANHFTNTIFTLSGFKLGDGMGKSVLINSAIQRYKSKAEKNRLSKRDKDYLKLLFGKDYNQAIQDLKAETQPSEYTDNELFIAYATILKYQPVGKTEVPLKYLEFGGVGRTFYMLKTFALKQLDVLRTRKDIISGKQKGNKKEKAVAATELLYLMGLMVMAGATGDEIKNWIQNKDESLSERVLDNILKLFLTSKYDLDKVKREAKYKGVITSVIENAGKNIVTFTPYEFGKKLIKDLEEEYKIRFEDVPKRSKLPSRIPAIGSVVNYNRYISEQLGIGGRGRDDYVYRKLNDYYKITQEKGKLTQEEYDIYKKLIKDAKDFPQKKLVKGKERRRINIDKHQKTLKKMSYKL